MFVLYCRLLSVSVDSQRDELVVVDIIVYLPMCKVLFGSVFAEQSNNPELHAMIKTNVQKFRYAAHVIKYVGAIQSTPPLLFSELATSTATATSLVASPHL